MNRERLQKAGLEFGRIVVLAIPSLVVGALIQVLTNNPGLSTGVGGLFLAALKSYDRGTHEDPTTPSTGLLPF